jgi:hypothetical protein
MILTYLQGYFLLEHLAKTFLTLLQVVWLYWPEDLPMAIDNREAAKGRRAYHGEHELIASNYIDIVNVCTFAGIPLVEQWLETDDEMELKGLYWRQLFDFRIKQLSVSPTQVFFFR